MEKVEGKSPTWIWCKPGTMIMHAIPIPKNVVAYRLRLPSHYMGYIRFRTLKEVRPEVGFLYNNPPIDILWNYLGLLCGGRSLRLIPHDNSQLVTYFRQEPGQKVRLILARR